MIKFKKQIQLYIEFQPWAFKHCSNIENLFETLLNQNEQKGVYYFVDFGIVLFKSTKNW